MNFIYIYIEKTDYDYTPRQAKVRNQEEAMGNPKPKKSKKIFLKKWVAFKKKNPRASWICNP